MTQKRECNANTDRKSENLEWLYRLNGDLYNRDNEHREPKEPF